MHAGLMMGAKDVHGLKHAVIRLNSFMIKIVNQSRHFCWLWCTQTTSDS